MSRDSDWLRSKRHGETWPRFAAEIPTELAEEIDGHLKSSKHGKLTRADAVRAGLRLYLAAQVPEKEEAIDGTAVDEPEALPPPTCRECGEPAVETEVHAWVELPKYEGFPLGPTGERRPAAYRYTCKNGHWWAEDRKPR